jgi:hypothetical protein
MMRNLIFAALLAGVLLAGARIASAQSDRPAAPAVGQARVVEVQVEPAAGTASGTLTLSGQAAVPPGAPGPMSVPSGGAVIMTPGTAIGVTGAAVALPAEGPEPSPQVEKRVFIRRVGDEPDMPGPMTVPFLAPEGAKKMFIAKATATLAGKAEKASFLGVVTTRVSATLRSQLKLKAGLVVDMVEPKSSAEAAGLQVHDIVEKCDDQWLINPAQFIGLVRMYKPGETVTLTVLREGERKKITAKLEERESYAVDEGPDFLYTRATPLDPRSQPNTVAVFAKPVEGFGGPVQQITAGALADAPLVPGLVATFGDDRQQLLISIRDGHQYLTAKDPSGKQIFEGPIDTPEQRKAVPASVLKQLEEMEKIKIKIRTNGPGKQ